MKLRILNYGLSATHDTITVLAPFENPVSVSDYDALVIDPLAWAGQTIGEFHRRRTELGDLIVKKGGVIICILRPDLGVSFSNAGVISGYLLFQQAAPRVEELVRGSVRAGVGSQWRLIPGANAVSSGYFRVLQDNLHFEAFLETNEATVSAAQGTILAVNSVGYPVAVEFIVGSGRLCFVPAPRDVTGDRVGAAIVGVVEAHFGGPAEIEAPVWAKEISVPGANASSDRIVELVERRSEIQAEISELERKRAELLNYRQLLFGYGRALERAVRQAFRQLGFVVPEPEEYQGKWDVDLTERESGRTAIGEIEGSEGAINVTKYRQLLDYFQAEILEGRLRKGILIGNGYRLKELGDPERQSQFTEQAQRGARQNNFCLLPTTELFKAVCAVLESPQAEALKTEIRNSLLLTVGGWTFARGTAARAAPAPSASLT